MFTYIKLLGNEYKTNKQINCYEILLLGKSEKLGEWTDLFDQGLT